MSQFPNTDYNCSSTQHINYEMFCLQTGVTEKMLNEGNQIHNFIPSSGSGTVINYGSGSDFLSSYDSFSASLKVTVPMVLVSQHCLQSIFTIELFCLQTGVTEMQWFLSPQGKMFRGRKAVLRHMKTEPGLFTAKEANIFKSVPLQVPAISGCTSYPFFRSRIQLRFSIMNPDFISPRSSDCGSGSDPWDPYFLSSRIRIL
jgi:hypothetical protein